ncbi:nitroreductase family protein [Marinomonas mediterranea]|uniref:nitroreductase family protein n=1 Tax=Marinomonas mediterranea TaxID=119864 RepID=UPI002349E18D|nr:nitroreductase family protein [Marinomonas mediterranea]WCN09512.1 nitroreductase family protein [Marinomonas mediterranea]WCN13587.1 nitroreductase family protein [Marinomonas mediterranea]
MSALNIIETRRSIKHFDSDHAMPDSTFERILNAAILAPTSFNIQHWRFVRVKNPLLRQKIREAAWDQEQITSASELVIVLGNSKAWSENPERYWKNAPTDVQGMLVPMLQQFYQGREWLQRDEAIRSGAMAAQNIMLAAEEMGYNTSPMIGIDFDQVAELINLPDDHVVVMLLAIGKGIQQAKPRGGQLPLRELLVEDAF